jgi:hypothetical protein
MTEDHKRLAASDIEAMSRAMVQQSEFISHEDRIIFNKYMKKGLKWSLIASTVPGHSDNAIKN